MANLFLDKWKQKNFEIFSQMYPELTKDEIMEVLDEDIKENFKDPDTHIFNDYQDDITLNQSMTALYKFCKEKKPILGGNGTLFYNQDIISSPIADLIDGRIKARKQYQKIRDTFPPGSEEYNHYDMLQLEAKIRINSIYGSFGAPSFQLYNINTAASTTGTAQSLISTTGISFEAFAANNVKFKTFSECMIFMMNVVNEEYELPELTIEKCADVNVIYDLMVAQFERKVFDPSIHGDIIMDFLETLSVDQLTKLFYKNRLYAFLSNQCILDNLVDAFNKMGKFNNPNAVPDIIKENMELLWMYCKEYVFYNHAYNERINRLKNDKRSVVKLIDTDSNLVYVQPWVDFLEEKMIPQCTKMTLDEDSKMFACVNTLAYLITSMLRVLLDKYCADCNVLERMAKRVNMKNEFCFTTLLLSNVKKRYVAKIVLNEGRPVVKTAIKGHDFKKAGVTEFVNNAMTDIVEKRILEPKNVDVPGILSDLDTIEKDIYRSLRAGERKYLIRMNCKVREAYKNPESMGQYLSVLAWNTICPEQEISLPDKLDVVIVKIPNSQAIVDMQRTHPYEYDRITKNLLETSPIPKFKKDGLTYIAIPNNIEKVTDFIIPYIDYNYIVSRNLGTFRSIRESLMLPDIGKSKQTFFSNIRYNTKIEI